MIELLSIAVISYIFIKILIKNAKKLNLLDLPNDRSYHCNITPRGGGIGFVFSFFLTIFIFKFPLFLEYWYIFVSILIVFLVGILDDIYNISPKSKFVAIFVSVFLLWLHGVDIDTIGLWFGYQINLIWWIALPFSMFALAGFTNALNLIDGIDGLAGSISIVILLSFYFIGYEYHNVLIMVISSFTIASLIGFMLLNWNPAKVFMGDSGSLTLGFIISILAVLSIKHIHPVTILYLAALPILDTFIVMTRRIRKGKSPFSPDKTHVHHILVKFFENNVKKTVIFLIIFQIVFSSVGYILLDMINRYKMGIIPFFAILGFIMIFLLSYMIFNGIKKRQIFLDNLDKKHR